METSTLFAICGLEKMLFVVRRTPWCGCKQGRAVTPEHQGLKIQLQNCSGVGSEETSTPEHNFSTAEHKTLKN